MKRHSFSEVVTDATSKFSKIKASDYHVQGRYKIIDQGKEPIAGYTDDANLVNGKLLPILIFGDHTRVLKYEDDPIALGADGAKALWVNPDLANARYIYYYLRSIQIKEAGYSRHFKFLKEVEIPIPMKDGAPNFDDQIRIAHLLGKVERLIAQRKQHLQQLDDLLKSVFLEMFGDPVRNEKGWDRLPLEKLGSLNRGVSKHRPRNAPELLGGKYPLIQTGEVSNAGTYINTFSHTYSEIGFAQSKLWPSGTLCITIAANIAQTGILTFDACFPDSVVAFSAFEHEAHVLYVHGLFWFFQKILEKNAPAAAQKNINLEILRGMEVPKPPIELQAQFAYVVEKVEGIKSRYQQSLTDLENLYGALSQQAFKGELDLSRIPLEKLANEDNATVKKMLRLSVESSLSKQAQDTLANLNTFNQTAASHFKALEEANRLTKLPWGQLNSVSRLAEQFASFRSPLQELSHMSALSKACEQAQAAMKKLNLERLESFTKTAELARNLALDVPKIDFDRLSLHDEFVKKANEPLESLRRTIEQFQIPSHSQHFSALLSEQLETAKRFQSTIPDFTTWQNNYSEVSEFDFDDSDKLFARYFEAEDVVGIISSANEPLSFESLLQQLGELSTVDFAGYERIKAIIFDLLANNRLKQIFDKNKQTLLFSIVETEPSQ